MKQLNFFDGGISQENALESNYWKLYVDGAARNNPGPAGAGVVIFKNDSCAKKTGAFLGTKTNNQAEYMALLLGLFYVQELMHKDDLLLVVSDSQLLVRQLQGVYRVKEPHLKPLHTLASTLLARHNYSLSHVLREENTQADEQANVALDKKTKLPPQFLEMLHEHGVSIHY